MKEGDTKGDEHGGLFFSLGLVVIPVGRHSFSGGGGCSSQDIPALSLFCFGLSCPPKGIRGTMDHKKHKFHGFLIKTSTLFSQPPLERFSLHKNTQANPPTQTRSLHKKKRKTEKVTSFLTNPLLIVPIFWPGTLVVEKWSAALGEQRGKVFLFTLASTVAVFSISFRFLYW